MNPPACSRREFLTASTALAAAALTGCASRGASAPAIIDTHTHFYDPTRPQGVPWPPADDLLLHRTVLPDDYRRLARPLGVTGTVVVEASPWIEDNQWILDLAAREPFLVGLVGHLKPGRTDFREHLDRFARNPLFRGIRTGLWDVKFDHQNRDFARDLARLADRDLALDVLIGPDQLDAVAALAAQIPALRLVIDHCANVRVDGGPPPAVWSDGIRTCGRRSNVFMKVSGLVEGTGRTDGSASSAVDFYRPVLEEIWREFGEERVIYGSNWPVSERFASLATVQGIVTDYVSTHGPTAASRYFHGNAVRAYRLVPRAA